MKLKEIKNPYQLYEILENQGKITFNAKTMKTFVLRDSQNKPIGKLSFDLLDLIPFKNMEIDSISKTNAVLTLDSYLYCDMNFPLSYGISVAKWLFLK